ncbi:MAG: phosphatase PAP2 family protein [Candidatus Competibacter denitrificans]
MSWDNDILLFAAAHRSDALDTLFRAVTWLGSLYLLIPLTLFSSAWLWHFQKRWEAELLVVGLGGATLLVHLMKLIFARPRPALGERLVPLPWDSSFPSAHTMQIAAFALCAVLITRRIWPQAWAVVAVLAVALIVLVGASRIYLQVHYPSDVLGGLVLSCLWIALAQQIF